MFTIRRKQSGLPRVCAVVLALASMAVAIGADVQPPTLMITEPVGLRLVDLDGVVSFAGTANDDIGIARVILRRW